jgi:hypothetical protein
MANQALSVTKSKKVMGRPKGEPTAVIRVPVAVLAGIDDWAAKQADKPSRAEALRRLVNDFLKLKGRS